MNVPGAEKTRALLTTQLKEWEPKLIPLTQGARRLNMTPDRAYRLIKQDQFPVPLVRVGKRWYLRSGDIDRFLDY